MTAFYPGTFPLEDADGNAIDIHSWLKEQETGPGTQVSRKAFFWYNCKRYEVRVAALQLTKTQAERYIKKKKKKAVKDKRKIQEETLYFASWVLVLTTLPEKDWTDQEVLSLYRARWQIEMLFKRIKQLFRIHSLNAKTAKTAKATVAALLVSWVLQQEVAVEMRSVLTEMYRELQETKEEQEKGEEQVIQVISEWRLQSLSVALFHQQVQGPLTRQRVIECLPQLKRHCVDSPRKRTNEWSRILQLLLKPENEGKVPVGGKSRNTGSALTATLA